MDESGIEKDLVRSHGRASRGCRVEDTKRGRKFCRTNVIAALRNGVVLAPECYEHSTTGDFFEEWFKTRLIPLAVKGQTITMDNASFHRKAKLAQLLENTGISLIFLPPYSPDFNPIEKKWANMKQALPDIIPNYETLQQAILSYLSF